MAWVKETGFSPGGRYTVQVRARSKTDQQRVSEWSNAFTFVTTADTVPPMPPSNLEMVSEGSSFIATWEAPTQNKNGTPCTDLSGYWVSFYNTDDDTQVTREIFTADKSYTLSFEDNQEMFGYAKGNLTIVVLAVDHMGNRSDTVEVSASNPPPADVTGLEVLPGIENISMSWDANTADIDLVGYKVYASTTGANFIPGPTNLKYTGTGTAFILPSSNPVPHHVKVYAVDIFGLQSVNAAYGLATPRTTTSSDGTPPDQPTGLTIDTVFGDSNGIKLSWTDPVDSDLDHILVRYSTDNVDWSYAQAPAGASSVILPGVQTNTDYYISIKSVDFSGNGSSWVNVSPYPYKTLVDTTPVPKPSAPAVYPSTGFMLLFHDLKDINDLPIKDIETVKVYTTTDPNVNDPNDAMEVATVTVTPGDPQLITTISLIGNDDMLQDETYWFVVAINKSGTRSVGSDSVLANPLQLDDSVFADLAIGNAKIGNIDANKLTVNSAFANNLFIRSKLTIDDLMGQIASSTYDAGLVKGWKIDRNGIVINEGAIKAKALEIQSSPNICPPEYSGFEFNKEMYHDQFNRVNEEYMSASSATVTLAVDADSRYGGQALRVMDSGAPSTSITLAPSGGSTVDVDALQTYIVSAYVKVLGATSKSIKLSVTTNGSQTFEATVSGSVSNGYQRVFVPMTLNATSTKLWISFVKVTASSTEYLLDGVQVERQIGALAEPGNYSPPGLTSISGEGITTGSIKSSAQAFDIPGQPAWSLNTQGNMQVGDALVRGKLTVGAGMDTTNSMVTSSDYLAGVSGWVIRGDGFAEFNNINLRSEMLVERNVIAPNSQNLTLRLKGSVTDYIVYTPGSTQTAVATPMISGQHFAYDRTTMTGGLYRPTAPNPNKKMRFAVGPTAVKNFVIQTNDNDTDGIYGSLPPDNVLTNTLTVGDQVDFTKKQVVRETVGFDQISYLRENPVRSFRRRSNGATKNAENHFYNTNFTRVNSAVNIRSPFSPESNDQRTEARDYYSNSNQIIESQSSYYGPSRNLIPAPYDYLVWSHTFNPDGNPIDNLNTTGAMQRTSAMTIQSQGEAMIGDPNYKIGAIVVRINTSTVDQVAYLAPSGTSTTGTSTSGWTNVYLKPNTKYIFSAYIKTDYHDSPTQPWRFGFFPRFATSNTASTNSYTYWDNMATGQKSQRVSVPFVTPASVTGRVLFAFYFPKQTALLNKRIGIARPQFEEVIWSEDSNPEIASSEAPTAWNSSVVGAWSENKAALKVTTNSSADSSYDAYGRYDPDYTDYAAEQVKVYREAPGYIDMEFNRKSYRLNGTTDAIESSQNNENRTSIRFSEAGIHQTGAYEPMRPAGVECVYINRTLPAKGETILSRHTFGALVSSTEHGAGTDDTLTKGDIRKAGIEEFEFMRTGFYMIHCGIHVQNSINAAIWMEFHVNGQNIHSQGIGRINVNGFNTSTVKFFNRGDKILMKAVSGPDNGGDFLIEGPRITIVRIS